MSAIRMYSIVTLTGAVIMALEILSSRILAPEFGNSVYVWGSIISVFLAALSLGYYLGGRLADRQPRLATLGRVLCFAAMFQLGLLAFGSPLTALVGAATDGSPVGTLIASTILFGPPSVLLATVSPFIVRLAARDLQELGNTAGKLYAVSTGGSLIGTLACTFLLIPMFQTHRILGFLLLLTSAVAIAALSSDLSRERSFVLLSVILALFAVHTMASDRALPSGALHFEVTPYQTLQVTEQDGQRLLYGDRALYSAMDLDDRQAAHTYQRFPAGALLLKPEIDSTLVIGMGSGGTGTYLRSQIPNIELDFVEIDPAVARVAENFFFFEDDARTRVHVEDARQFLRNADRKWDYILNHAYIGLSVPFHLTTVEFLQEVKRHLNSGGVFGVTLASGIDDPFPRAIFHTLSQEFRQVFLFRVSRASNVLLLATDADLSLPREEMIRLGRNLDEQYDFEPSLTEIATGRMAITLDPSEAVLLTDSFAPANHLVVAGTMPESLKR